jgi:uncharacterized protein
MMERIADIVHKASGYALSLLRERSPSWARYHRPEHTNATVESAMRIGLGMGVDQESLEVLQLAGWFHDTGYTETVEAHEDRSAGIARAFLAKEGYPTVLVERVVQCIAATRLPQSPATLEQQVLCDADVHHAGTGEFFLLGDLLREEVELRDGIRYDDAGWLKVNLEFLYQHPFHTSFARREFGPGRKANIAEVERRLAAKNALSS